jgi:hypothetical protein
LLDGKEGLTVRVRQMNSTKWQMSLSPLTTESGRQCLASEGDAERGVHGVECPNAEAKQCTDHGG